MSAAGNVKFKLQWRPQDAGDARNMEHLLRKTTGNEWSHPKREAMWAVASKTIWAGLPKLVGVYIRSHGPYVGHGATGFSVCPAGFWSYIGLIPPFCVPILSF
jgi:hypothetical protein